MNAIVEVLKWLDKLMSLDPNFKNAHLQKPTIADQFTLCFEDGAFYILYIVLKWHYKHS
jgi:hypothetical protein